MSRSELHNWECAIEQLSGDNADKMLVIAQDIYDTAFVRGKNYMLLEQTELNPSYNSIKTELEPCEDCISKEKMIKVIERMEKLEEDLYRTEGAESSFATLCLCVEWIKEALE